MESEDQQQQPHEEPALEQSENNAKIASPSADQNGDHLERHRSPSPRKERHQEENNQTASSSNGGDSVSVNPGNNLFVTQLSMRTREPQLEELFSKYGKIERVQIMYDPHSRESRGFGFVSFFEAADADSAMEALNGMELDGKTILIQKAKRARPRTPTPGRYFGPASSSRRDGGRRSAGPYDRYSSRRDDRYYDSRYGGDHHRRGGGGGYYDERREYGSHGGMRGREYYDAGGYRYDDHRQPYHAPPHHPRNDYPPPHFPSQHYQDHQYSGRNRSPSYR